MSWTIEELEQIVAPVSVDKKTFDQIVEWWLDGVNITVNGDPLWR